MFELWRAQRNRAKMNRRYRKEAAALRETGSPLEQEELAGDWHFHDVMAEDSISAIVTQRLIAKANKLDLPTPPYPKARDEENPCWYYSDDGTERLLTAQGRTVLRDSIRKEKRERFEARSRWVTLITGILGAAIGLVTVLTNLLVRVLVKH